MPMQPQVQPQQIDVGDILRAIFTALNETHKACIRIEVNISNISSRVAKIEERIEGMEKRALVLHER
jgi:hypothetical protein